MEKRITWLAVSLMISIFSPAHAFTLTSENHVDLPGCDYKNFDVPDNVPYNVCMDACGLDSNCQAWNLDSSSGKTVCYLKNCSPAPVASTTISGVKLQATMSDPETGTDRPGCDIGVLPGAKMTIQICLAACAVNNNCQAWNFDVPRSGTNTCYLKNCVPAPTFSLYTTSGVKFSQ
jgi:hypothetical protein